MQSWLLLPLAFLVLRPARAGAGDGPAIQRLIDEAIRQRRPRLELPAGRIEIAKNLVVRGAKELVIEGRQTTLVFADHRATGIVVQRCHGLRLQGFQVDYDPLPFLQGTITGRAADGKWIDVEIHQAYPGFTPADGENLRYVPAYVFEPDRPRWKRWVPDLYPREVVVRDARHGRLIFGRAPEFFENIASGDRLVITRRTGCGLRMDDCQDVRVEDVTFLAAPGAALLGRYMRGDNFFRYTVRPGPPPKGATQLRLISTCADAFNYAFATRGPTLEGCRFSYMGDDSVNLHGAVLAVVRQETPTQVLAAWPYSPESLATVIPAGAEVRRLRPGNFEIVAKAPIEKFVVESNRLSDDLAVIHKIWPRNPEGRGTIWRLMLSQPLPGDPGDLLDIRQSNSPGFVIRNCTFEDHRARGLRIMAGQGLIEKNIFRRLRHAAITLGGEYGFWREAGWVDQITVRDNRIEDVCQDYGAFSPRSYCLGAISVFVRRDDKSRLPYWPGNRGLRIENNSIDGCTTAGIHVAAAEEVEVRGNRLRHVLYGPASGAGQEAGLQLDGPITIDRSARARMGENQVEATGQAPEGVAGAFPLTRPK